MHTDLDIVLTAIGPDRPGLVEELAGIIARHRGNWLDSSMAQLAGQFAGIVRVRVGASDADALETALTAANGLQVVTRRVETSQVTGARRRWVLEVVGHDRPGIVRDISQVLAQHAFNVESLDTFISSAPMSAEALFHATVRASGGAEADLAHAKTALEAISRELMVEITLDEVIDQ